MFKKHKQYLFIIIAISFSFIVSCKKDKVEYIHIKGKITNKMNGNPISYADIYISQKCNISGGGMGSFNLGGGGGDYTYKHGESDKNGNYDLNVKIGKDDGDCMNYELLIQYNYNENYGVNSVKILRNENSTRDFGFYIHTILTISFQHTSSQPLYIGQIKIIRVDPETSYPIDHWSDQGTYIVYATTGAMNYIQYELRDSLSQVSLHLDSIYCKEDKPDYYLNIKY